MFIKILNWPRSYMHVFDKFQVRTKERVFDSIQHLIDYHVQNGAPIRSLDSEIKLIFPVSTHTFCIS